MNPAGLNVTTPTDTTIVMTRAFNAPRRLVWEAMTDPAQLRRWMFAPPGWVMTVCEFEPRVGDGYKWVWKNQHADPAMTIHGTITEVVLHERIVHTQVMEMGQCGPMAEFSVILEFTEKHGNTRMRLTLAFGSKDARDDALKWGMEHGMEAGYKQLDTMLSQLA
ncbi:MAG: SRPBCC domain-containing protein [Phycisphaerales bacterium]